MPRSVDSPVSGLATFGRALRPPLLRSYLYVPATEPAKMRKALVAGADAVVLDLEDAVPRDQKVAARENIAKFLQEGHPPAPRIHVRINWSRGRYDRDDLESAVVAGLDGIRLPKAESREAIEDVAAVLDNIEGQQGLPRGGIGLYPTVETATGVVRIPELVLARRVQRLGYGAADLVSDLGLPAAGGDALTVLRAELVLQSRAAGIGAPIDTVFTDLDDEEGLRAAAVAARRSGFSGKSVIHPRQIQAVHDAFTPSPEEVARARRIVAAVGAAGAESAGIVVDGEFVDRPIVTRARATLDLCEALARGPDT